MNELQRQTYHQQLNPWCIVRHLPKMQRVVVGRFRSQSDAQGHMTVLRGLVPHTSHKIIFDPPSARKRYSISQANEVQSSKANS